MRWAVLATLVVLVVVGCVPLILEERHEFVVEVVGGEYLDEVMDWYQPNYSDYILQKPVIVLYYPSDFLVYSTRKSYYQMPEDFVAAGGDIVDPSNLSADLNKIWSSYTPTYDIDVWWQDDAKEWQAKVKDLSKTITLEGYKFFLIEFNKEIHGSGKIYYKVKGLREVEPDKNNIFHLGDVKDGFVVILQEDPSQRASSKGILGESNTKILGAEVVWPVSQ